MKNFLLMLIFAAMLAGCNKDKVDPDNPTQSVPDPEETVILSMRNANNGGTSLDGIYIDREDNFTGAYFVSVGTVKGLGNVTTIPKTGWSNKIAVTPGMGYVVFIQSKGIFYRIFVIEYTASTLGGVIGAELKYQKPFVGKSDITLEQDAVSFTEAESGALLYFQGANIEVFSLVSNEWWCSPTIGYVLENGNSTLNSFLSINAPAQSAFDSREAVIKIKNAAGNEKEVKVIQAGAEPPKSFAGGGGTLNNPYLIRTAEQLDLIREYSSNNYFKIENDIDMTAFLSGITKGWEPINANTISLDGGGHKITGLWINRPDEQYVGLFGRLDGANSISRCSVSGTIVGGEYTGGIIGYCHESINCSECYSSAKITGTKVVGGILGYATYAYYGSSISIINSYSTGEISVNGGVYQSYVGGLVGQLNRYNSPITITNCYVTGKLTTDYSYGGSALKGGIFGHDNYNITVTSSYFNSEATTATAGWWYGNNQPNTNGSKTTAQMKQQATYVGWDFSAIWKISEGVSYPTLRAFP